MARWNASHHIQATADAPPPTTPEAIEAKYGPRIDGVEPTEVFVVELDARPIGMMQWTPGRSYAWWPTEMGCADHYALDWWVGEPELVGRGIGTAAGERFVRMLLDRFPATPGAVTAPRRTNIASCRMAEKIGFRCVFEGDFPRDGLTDRRVYLLRRPR